MFKEIEKIYKEKSGINIITRIVIIIYWIIIGFVWFFGIKKSAWISLLIIIVMMLLMLILVKHWLKIKTEFNKRKIKCKIDSLKDSLREQEYELIKEYLIKNKIMNIENIKNIISHYRNLTKPKIKKTELISILSLIITILFSVIDDNGFKVDIINNVLPHVLIFLVIYKLYQAVCYLINALNGEDGMYERLEEIFSEILVEIITDENKKNKSTNIRAKKKKI